MDKTQHLGGKWQQCQQRCWDQDVRQLERIPRLSSHVKSNPAVGRQKQTANLVQNRLLGAYPRSHSQTIFYGCVSRCEMAGLGVSRNQFSLLCVLWKELVAQLDLLRAAYPRFI